MPNHKTPQDSAEPTLSTARGEDSGAIPNARSEGEEAPTPDREMGTSVQRVIVRYVVHPDRIAENLKLVSAVFVELDSAKPPAFRYVSYHDGQGTFTHVAEIRESLRDGAGEAPGASIRPTEATVQAARNPLQQLASFRAFVSDIASRCAQAPVALTVACVGRYECEP